MVAWEREIAEREARLLGEQMWERRAEFAPEAETANLAEAVERAMAVSDGPVFVSDSGDNVTAGGAGDLPLVLEELLRVTKLSRVVGIDATVAEAVASVSGGAPA